MKRSLPGWVLIPTFLLSSVSCDSVDIGRPDEPTGPPKLLRIMVQDENRTGGRFLATNLLNVAPDIKCSDTNPCPAYLFVSCDIPAGMTEGLCHDTEKPANTPPAIGIPKRHGGNAIRLVFDRILDPAISSEAVDAMSMPLAPDKEAPPLKDPTTVVLKDWTGAVVPALVYYEPSGNPTGTVDVIRIPYGPAIVIKPEDQLAAGGEYKIVIKPELIKDKKGQAVATDADGPIKTEYTMKMEALYPPDGPLAADITPADGFQLALNAAADVTSTVTLSAVKLIVSSTRSVDVKVQIFADQGTDTACADGDPSVVYIAHVDAAGSPVDWDEGEYEYDFSTFVKSTAGTNLSADAFGAAFAGTFTVTATTADPALPAADLLYPEQCE